MIISFFANNYWYINLMSTEEKTQDDKQILRARTASRIRWVWVVGSGVGSLVGAGLALWMFRYVYVFYSIWFTFRFAITIGIPIALSQWLILHYVSRYIEKTHTSILFLWIPVTSIGIAFLILPMAFALTPSDYPSLSAIFTVVYMLPGMLFMGLSQWLILRLTMAVKFAWAVNTTIGTVTGLIIGYGVGQLTIELIPIEAMWPIVASVIIAVFQCFYLANKVFKS